jgi:hypothetical protein
LGFGVELVFHKALILSGFGRPHQSFKPTKPAPLHGGWAGGAHRGR